MPVGKRQRQTKPGRLLYLDFEGERVPMQHKTGRRITSPWDGVRSSSSSDDVLADNVAPADGGSESVRSRDTMEKTGTANGVSDKALKHAVCGIPRRILLAAVVVLFVVCAVVGGWAGAMSMGSGGGAGVTGSVDGNDRISEGSTTSTTTTEPLRGNSTGLYYCQNPANASGPYTADACGPLCINMTRRHVCCSPAAGESCTPDGQYSLALDRCMPRPPPTCEPSMPAWARCDPSTPAYLSSAAISRQGAGFPVSYGGSGSPSSDARHPSAALRLPASVPGQLLTLKTVGPDCAARPVARSYDGHPWEGVLPAPVQPDCDDVQGRCFVNLLTRDGSASDTFRIDSVAGFPGVTEAEAAARLLQQASFGPRQEEVTALTGTLGAEDIADDRDISKAAAWIDEQMAMPPILMRSYVRERSNPRRHTAFPQGPVVGSCE